MSASFQVGYSTQTHPSGRLGAAGRRRHVVERDDAGDEWKLVCTGTPGTREYKGYAAAVTCRDCRNWIAARAERVVELPTETCPRCGVPLTSHPAECPWNPPDRSPS